MKLDFSYYMPTRIIFGCGKLSELETTPYLPGKKALVVIGAAGAMKKHGYLDRVTKYLNKNGVETVVYDRIQPNPVSEHVEEGASVARENNCDFVVGLGGGSSIDSAKSIAVMAVNPGRYWDYIARGSGGGKRGAAHRGYNDDRRDRNRSGPMDGDYQERDKREDRLGRQLHVSVPVNRRSGTDGQRARENYCLHRDGCFLSLGRNVPCNGQPADE